MKTAEESKFKINGQNSYISSFFGKRNGGPLKPYIEMELGSSNDFLTAKQARIIASLLIYHADRIEATDD